MDLRSLQRPLKKSYREDASQARITLTAKGEQTEAGPISCSIDIGRAIYEAQAHEGVGGAGTGACSGDLLLGALAACKQITIQMVATAMELPVTDVRVTVEGDLDLRGTLGIDRETPVGFSEIRTDVKIEGSLTAEQLQSLQEKSEQYCVVLQTLQNKPPMSIKWQQT
ncbi:MAG: OsmC family protein [Thermaerobacterales bacterium]